MLDSYREPLQYHNRSLRTITGALLFGPAGDRLAVDILDHQPGFSGSIDFIHKMNITQLFTVTCGGEADFSQSDAVWYRTHMTNAYENEAIAFTERKTIAADDTALSLMHWRNVSTRDIMLTFVSAPEGFVPQPGGLHYSESPELRFGIRLGIAAGWSLPEDTITLPPGGEIAMAAVAAVGNLLTDAPESIRARTDAYLREAIAAPDALFDRIVAENSRFYDEAPEFLCDDKLINACWQYRWYILKNTVCKPGMGRFPQAVMYEGRDHRMQKKALSPSGWEFSKLIPLSTPLQVNDLRWHPDHALTHDIIRSAFAAQDEDGLLLTAFVEDSAKSYANYMLWAIWLNYQLDGDKAFLREMLPRMVQYIAGHERAYGNPRDSLLIERTHSLTGKEYQPSYWYFKDFPPNPKDPAGFTPLKRVDRSVYHCLNLRGLAGMMQVLGLPEEAAYRAKERAVAQDIQTKMWDADTGFYYDLHYETDEKAMVRNIVGVYPYWAGIAGEENAQGILPLMDAEAFATGSGFASVSRDCPVFSPAGGWMGNYFKGRNGCVWCGPSWPYTTGIALEALAQESRKHGHRYDAQFNEIFQQYTIQHFRDGDWHRPYLVEHYNPITGERLSDEADYNHSFWLDIVVRFVAGITVGEGFIEVEPLHTHLRWFSLRRIMIRGHEVGVTFACADNPHGIPQGLTVTVDGVGTKTDGGAVRISI